ncbi:hypothetical protein C8J57DRAFT_1236881 [Mycena rebaudengoi]|nr:hypothetical protein C8J57DRAFT_1236881 [Mycena rebaudengoi]
MEVNYQIPFLPPLFILSQQHVKSGFSTCQQPHSTRQLFSVFLWLPNLPERKKIEMKWKESVGYTVWIDWRRQRIYCPARKQSGYRPQLEWEANVAEFVLFLHRETRVPAVPQGSTEISSERALRCEAGQLECYGLARGSWTVGKKQRFQLCYKTCIPDAGSTTPKNGCFATTSQKFWKTWSIGKFRTVTSIPGGIPYFFSHCAVAQDLFDLIIELRPLSTPGGLAENIRSRSKLVKSTLSFSNEGNEIVAWPFYQSASPAEKHEVLEGFKKCCVELNVDLPEMMVVDNCCQVRNDDHVEVARQPWIGGCAEAALNASSTGGIYYIDPSQRVSADDGYLTGLAN